MSEERRSGRRAAIAGVRVTYESAAGGRVESDVVDLAAGGLFVKTDAPLHVGQRIAVDLVVLGESSPWSALARVVWVRAEAESAEKPAGMGVKLIDTDDAMLASIERLLDTREPTVPGLGSVPPVAPVAPAGALPPPPAGREPTLVGVGGEAPPPSTSTPIAPATDEGRATKPPAHEESPAGRWVVIVLLVVVAAIAAYVLFDGFLRPIGR